MRVGCAAVAACSRSAARQIKSIRLGATLQNSTKTNMKTRRHGPAAGPISGSSRRSERKSNTIPNVQKVDFKARYERYMALAQAAKSTGDAVEIENYYQHAEHYFRLMKEQAQPSIRPNRNSRPEFAGQHQDRY